MNKGMNNNTWKSYQNQYCASIGVAPGDIMQPARQKLPNRSGLEREAPGDNAGYARRQL